MFLWLVQVAVNFAILLVFLEQKMKLSIKDFLSKSDQIYSFLWIWSHLLKKSLMEKFFFSAVLISKMVRQYFQTFSE